MKKLFLLFIVVCVAVSTNGCVTITPVGPMANIFPSKKAAEEAAMPTEPIIQPAPKPVPPAMLVTPGEVAENNITGAMDKLKQELEQDRRSMENMPKSSEISVLKKQR